jgi:hypothetical protein
LSFVEHVGRGAVAFKAQYLPGTSLFWASFCLILGILGIAVVVPALWGAPTTPAVITFGNVVGRVLGRLRATPPAISAFSGIALPDVVVRCLAAAVSSDARGYFFLLFKQTGYVFQTYRFCRRRRLAGWFRFSTAAARIAVVVSLCGHLRITAGFVAVVDGTVVRNYSYFGAGRRCAGSSGEFHYRRIRPSVVTIKPCEGCDALARTTSELRASNSVGVHENCAC